MPRCIQCNAELGGTGDNFRVASISGGVLGDELTEAYLWCETCGLYTLEVVYEPFLGDEEVSYRGPISREEGDASIALIRQCDTPWDKKCRCAAHRAYFRDTLD
jgi:hypothetical protein